MYTYILWRGKDVSKNSMSCIFFLEGNLLAFGILHETSPPQRSNDDVDTNDIIMQSYLIFVIFFTQASFLENKIYTEKNA